MRISDWSSDVCSSDLPDGSPGPRGAGTGHCGARFVLCGHGPHDVARPVRAAADENRSAVRACGILLAHHHRVRSEEPTSELQSLMRTSYAVFCLKKTIILTFSQTTYIPVNALT